MGQRQGSIGGITLDCIISSLVDTHLIATSGFGFDHNRVQHLVNHIRLQHFYMILHVKCCSPMWFNPRQSVTLLCVSSKNQIVQFDVLPRIDGSDRPRTPESLLPGIVLRVLFDP